MLEVSPQSLKSKRCSACGVTLPLTQFGVQKRGAFGCKSQCKGCLTKIEVARRASDPEGQRAYKRTWWAQHLFTPEEREKAVAKARSWYASNKARHAKTLKLWVDAHREAVNIIQARRRAKKRAVPNTLTPEEWQQTLEVFNHACGYCLRTDLPLTIDHVEPISRGGPHTAENVVPACKPCNCSKNNRPIFVMLNR